MIKENWMNARLKLMPCSNYTVIKSQLITPPVDWRKRSLYCSYTYHSNKQSMEILEVTLRLAQVLEASQIHLKRGVEDKLLRNTSEMESHIQSMLAGQKSRCNPVCHP
jgi:hypothetical protein